MSDLKSDKSSGGPPSGGHSFGLPSGFDPRRREGYRVWTEIPIRFSDQDVMGHVNNAVIATYFEHARCLHLIPKIVRPETPHLNIVLARIVIDYRQEILYPGRVDVGIKIARIGNKSFVVAGAIFSGDTCAVTSEATIVFFDTVKRISAQPPAATLAVLDAFR
jgi:acyl-CoA thioester hydrolase